MIGVTFRQLEVFVALVDAGSFRGCAESLSISQVAVSEHVRALERQVGRPLLERRRGATARLTAAGAQAHAHARQILGQTREMLQVLRPEAEPDGRLRIAGHGYIVELVAPRVVELAHAHPMAAIEIERRPFESVLESLKAHAIDIGLFLSYGATPELSSEVAWQEPLGLYVGARHPLAGRAAVEPSDLRRQPFVYLPAGTHLRLQLDRVLASIGIEECPLALVSEDHAPIPIRLAGGASFACLFARSADPLVERGELVRLRFARPIPPLDVRYAMPAGHNGGPLVQELIRRLADGPA